MSATTHTRRDDVQAFVTKDASSIRELMHPQYRIGRFAYPMRLRPRV